MEERNSLNNHNDDKRDVVLPGSYQAGINDSGVEHSRHKLAESSKQLQEKITQLIEHNEDDGNVDDNSTQKHQMLPKTRISTHPCLSEEETWSYRCRCSFQILYDHNNNRYYYAMRQNGEPLSLGNKNIFPIATIRIQNAMKQLMDLILNAQCDHNSQKKEYAHISSNLSSCTFSSAWNDKPDADCILTLNYEQPIDEVTWKLEAQTVCNLLDLRHLNGRSKGILISVRDSDDQEEIDDNKLIEGTIRDTVYLFSKTNKSNDREHIEWTVSLDNPIDSSSDGSDQNNRGSIVDVRYEKPETAFYHPNASAMIKALTWMLNRVTLIAEERRANNQLNGCRLLEMYCGCGAHTVALGRTGLLSHILAVELDHRLVEACQHNIKLNSLQSLVEVRRSDAGQWAVEESRRRRRRQRNNKERTNRK